MSTPVESTIQPTQAPVAPQRAPAMRQERVSWGGIFAGTAIALALMVLFSTIGMAIGAMTIDPEGGVSLGGLSIFSVIYVIVTQLISVAAGAFAAARLAGTPRTMAAMMHGAAVWAVTTLVAAFMAVSAGGAVITATSSLLSATARGVETAADALVPENVSFPDIAEIAGQVSFADLPPELRQTLRDNDITPQQLRDEVQTAYRNVVSEQQQQRAVAVVRNALRDALQSPGDIGQDVNEAIDRLVQGENAVFGEEDVAEARTALRTNLNLSEEEVDQILATVEARFEATVEELRATVADMQERAIAFAERATATLSATSWGLALASVIGLAAGIGGGFAGRPRDLIGDRVDDHAATA